MHLFLKDATGKMAEGVVVAVGRNRIRLAARGWADVLEIVYSDGRWATGDGQVWEIESLITDGYVSGDFFDDSFVRATAA